MSLIFFDTETDSLESDCQIIQLAAVAVSPDWTEIEAFERKILFDEERAEPEALRINHYDRDMWLREGKDERVVVTDFSMFLKRHSSLEMVSKRTGNPYLVARLAGHNAATFDGPRLRAMFGRHNAFLPAHPISMDTLQRAIWYLHERQIAIDSLRLESLCKHFGVDLPDSHDALADARAAAQIARAMCFQSSGVHVSPVGAP